MRGYRGGHSAQTSVGDMLRGLPRRLMKKTCGAGLQKTDE